VSPRRAAVATAAAFLAAAAVGGFLGPTARTAGPTLLTAVLLLVPLAHGATQVGLTRPRWAAVWPGLAAACLLLPLFHLALQRGLWTMPAGPLRGAAPTALTLFAIRHLVDVVLPEELFFRGYLQRAWGSEGSSLHRGVWLQAVAFGALHVVAFGGSPAALDRAVPGVLFGVLRARTGAVWAPVIFHLACNLYAFTR
jgi:membrane protease YdiL (CAAX protease family)